MSQQTQKCSNCRAQIAESVYALHEIYCARNNVECKRCGQFYDKNDPESHEEEFHKGTACEHCKQVFQDISKHSNCSKKPVPCIHCGLDQQKDSIFQHENMCGSRTEKCETCKQYVMIRELAKHQCVIKPKEEVKETKIIPKTTEQVQKPQPQPQLQQQQQFITPNQQEIRKYDQRVKQQYVQQPEKEYFRPQQQLQAKHEIFGFEKPYPTQQQRDLPTRVDKPTEIREQLYTQNRPVQYQNAPVPQQKIVDQKYKPREVPLQPANGSKRPSSNLPEHRNHQLNDKYQHEPQAYKPQDRRPVDPRLGGQVPPKVDSNKQLDTKQIQQEYKFQDQNIRQQNRHNSQQQPQKPTKPFEEEVDYLALGLTKEEVQQQKAYLESIEQNRKQKEPQSRGVEYKPDLLARAYNR